LYNSMQFAYRYTWNREIIVNSQKLVKRRWISGNIRSHVGELHVLLRRQTSCGALRRRYRRNDHIGIIGLSQTATYIQSPSSCSSSNKENTKRWLPCATAVGFSSPLSLSHTLLSPHFNVLLVLLQVRWIMQNLPNRHKEKKYVICLCCKYKYND